MNLRELWGRLRAWYGARAVREQRLLVAATVVVAIGLFDLGVIEPIRQYRKGVQEEVEAGLNKLQHDLKRVGRIDELKARRTELRKRLDQVKQRLLPGDTGTLGAAALQDRANAIATDKGITVQSTQVMKEEAAEPFRKVSVRLTLSTEPKPLAEFLSAIEYTQQLAVPFLEVSRRGAVPGQKGPRTMQVSIEIAGFVEGKRAKGDEDRASGEGEAVEGAAAQDAPGGENPAEPGVEKPGGEKATNPAEIAPPTGGAGAPSTVIVPPSTVPGPPSTLLVPPPVVPALPSTLPPATLPAGPPPTMAAPPAPPTTVPAPSGTSES